MLKKLFFPEEKDICPNCGEACAITDVLCPQCGKNLDDLFEQLPSEVLDPKPFITLRREHKLLIKWTLATAIGVALGEVFLTPLAFTLVPHIPAQNGFDLFGILLGLASGIATGISVGAFQWVILREYMTHSWWWIVATPIGMASGSILEMLLFELERHYLRLSIWEKIYPIDVWIIILFYGLVIGLAQWIIIRQHIPRSWIWVITSGFGWAFAITIGEDFVYPLFYPVSDLGFIAYFTDPFAEIVIHGTVGILVGVITGVLLLQLFKRNYIMIKGAA